MAQTHVYWRVLILATVLMLGGGLYLLGRQQISDYAAYQHQVAQNSVRGAARQIVSHIDDLKKAVHLVAENQQALLRRLAAEPDNENVYALLDQRIRESFPNYYAFTITDERGHVIYDDFGERVGQLCRTDIVNEIAGATAPKIQIHPGPTAYHYDIMVRRRNSPPAGLFFVSFTPTMIAGLIKDSEVAGHELLLVRRDVPDLVEIASTGSRDTMQRGFHLSDREQRRISHALALPETNWILLDLPHEDLLPSYARRVWTANLTAGGAFVLVAGIFVVLIRREELKRAAAETALRRSHDQLEAHVTQRTAELQTANDELQHEIVERRKLQSAATGQQSVLRLIAAGRPLAEVLDRLAHAMTDVDATRACAIYAYDSAENILTIQASANLSDSMVRAAHDVSLDDDSTCGAAALRLEPVLALDVATSPECRRTGTMIQAEGYQSCCSFPALSSEGTLLGTICVYYRKLLGATEVELEMARTAADIVGIAIQRNREEMRTRKLSSAVEQTDDAIIITDRHGIVEYVNPAFQRITGYTADEAVGRKCNLIRSHLHDEAFYRHLWETILLGRTFRDIFINRRKDGSLFHEEQTITPLRDERGEVSHFLATGKDITDRMEAQKRLHHLAHHDVLTGLPNRALLRDRLAHAFAQADRNEQLVAILFLDLDRFKTINDSLGHVAGDQLLQAVSQRLRETVRGSDTVARLGGDEFTIVLEGVKHVSGASAGAQKILDALEPAFNINGHEIFITTSIGITIYPFDDDDLDNLLRNADTAMYHAKEAGGGSYAFFTRDMSARSIQRLTLENKLRHAVEREQFELHYQPRISLHDGRVQGLEALLRWRDPNQGLVAPLQFIPTLEETGLIIPVGRWVLDRACALSAALSESGYRGIRMAVNLSARQLREHSLVDTVVGILKSHGLDADQLELEITESLLMENLDVAAETLSMLHGAGVHISLDDFGTGYSSLSYLKRLPFSRIKIDRSFIRDMTADGDGAALVSAMIAMASNLRLQVTAEGVETDEQMAFLQEHHCDEVQGYLLGRPMAEAALMDWLRQWVSGNSGIERFRAAK